MTDFVILIALAVFGIIIYIFDFWTAMDRYYYYYGSSLRLPYIFIMLFFLLCLVVGILGVMGKLPV